MECHMIDGIISSAFTREHKCRKSDFGIRKMKYDVSCAKKRHKEVAHGAKRIVRSSGWVKLLLIEKLSPSDLDVNKQLYKAFSEGWLAVFQMILSSDKV